jgi:DNA-binding CsgD family transcriptional regulator
MGRGRRSEYKEGTNRITARELETLQLAADGFSCEESGAIMKIGGMAVKNHRRDLFNKMGAENIAQAVAMAIRRKLIE